MNKTINSEAIEAEHRLVFLCIEDIERIDRVDADTADFVDMRWKACIEELRSIREQSGKVDALVLMDALISKHKPLKLGDFTNPDASPHLLEAYSRIVTDEACKRRLRLGVSKALEILNAGEGIEEALSATAQAMTDATVGEKAKALSASRVVAGRCMELADIAERKAKGEEVSTGLLCGIEGVDSILHGFTLGIPTLIAARPAMGKSALALNISDGVSSRGNGVHVFSLEDLRSAYADRIISMHSGVSTTKIRACDFNVGERDDIAQALNTIQKREGWLVDDRSGITADEIVRSVRIEADKNNTKMVVIDYIQLIRGIGNQDTKDKLSYAINAFGDAAKRDNMAYVVLSQLNRDCEKRPDKRPMLSDLKECGTLEERAKCVIMVYRDAVYNPPHENDREAKGKNRAMEILIRKNTNGEIGWTEAEWIAERMLVR